MNLKPLFSGRLVVERAHWFPARDALTCPVSNLGLSLDEAIAKYRGADGNAIEAEVLSELGLSQELGLLVAELSSGELLDRLRKLGTRGPLDVVDCAFLPQNSNGLEELESSAGFLGFDFAFWGFGEWAYSVVFHEVLFGRQPHLAELAPLLNQNLLFPNGTALGELRIRREQLVGEGVDLEVAAEPDDGPYIVAVSAVLDDRAATAG